MPHYQHFTEFLRVCLNGLTKNIPPHVAGKDVIQLTVIVIGRYDCDFTEHLTQMNFRTPLPRMMLINLDRCLIDCGGESIARMTPPFTQEGGEIYDGNDNQIIVREGVREMLRHIFKAGITLAVFGETDRPDIARWVMHHLNLESCFTYFGLSHDGRQDQISGVRRKAQMEIDDLLVVDNMHGGGPEWCESSGVVCYAIPGQGGLTPQHLAAALELYRINAP